MTLAAPIIAAFVAVRPAANDGRKLDHKTLEALRIRAVDQVGEGAHPEDVAAALGLHRKTVYAWLARYREGGKDALKAQPVPGLAAEAGRAAAVAAVCADCRAGSAADAVRVRVVDPGDGPRGDPPGIRRGIERGQRGLTLRKLGMSPQRPLHRAYQQDPQAVERWKTEEYPAIRAQAEAEGATVWFADEAGIRSDYHAGTTWSPVGQTPQVKNTGARYSVNMISVVSAKGALRFAIYEGSTNAATFIDFCKRLLHDAAGPVYLIVDGHPAHRATATKEFAASTEG